MLKKKKKLSLKSLLWTPVHKRSSMSSCNRLAISAYLVLLAVVRIRDSKSVIDLNGFCVQFKNKSLWHNIILANKMLVETLLE